MEACGIKLMNLKGSLKPAAEAIQKIENDWSANSFSVINTYVGVAAETCAADINPLVVSNKIPCAPIPASCHLDEGWAEQIESVKCFE
jgi:hypothetical protein